MAIAILRQNTDLIWLDAVIQWDKNYSASVTKHRVEQGGKISDHASEENPTFSISGVVSGVDFGSTKPIISEEDAKAYGIGTEINVEQINHVVISSTKQPLIVKLLPDSLRQFLTSDVPPSVEFQPARLVESDIMITIERILIELNRGVKKIVNKRNVTQKELVTILEFDQNGKIINDHKDCFLTSVSFSENADSGYALYPNLTFEQIRFVPLISTTIPTNVAPSVKNVRVDKSDKGKQQADSATGETTGLNASTESTKTDNSSVASSFRNLGQGDQ